MRATACTAIFGALLATLASAGPAPVDVQVWDDAEASLVAVSVFGDANPSCQFLDPCYLGVSIFGNATGGTLAAAGTGDAGSWGVALSAFGDTADDSYWPVASVAGGDAAGTSLAVSVFGDAEGRGPACIGVCPNGYAASVNGDASGGLAVSVLGDATAVRVLECVGSPVPIFCIPAAAASAAGDAEGPVAVAVVGSATACWQPVPWYPRCELGTLAVSGLGNAETCRVATPREVWRTCAALSATGDASGAHAISGTGDSEGAIAVSGTGHASGGTAVSGCQESGGRICLDPI